MTRGVAVTGKWAASQIEGATVSKQQWWGWKAKWRDVVMAAGYKIVRDQTKKRKKEKQVSVELVQMVATVSCRCRLLRRAGSEPY